MNNVNDNRENIDLKLSFKPEREQVISKVQKEIIEEELNKFDMIKENDINISTSYVFDNGDNLEASVFFRNGLSSKINFEDVLLLLVDDNEKIIASKNFNLRLMGDIPSKSARPWKLYFDKTDIEVIPDSLEKCKVMFNKKMKVCSTVDVEFENIAENKNINLQKDLNLYLESLPKLEKGQLTINTYRAKLEKEGQIVVSIVVRNGGSKRVKIDQLPITIYDGNEQKICSVLLDMKNLEVNPFKAKLYNLILDFQPEKYTDYDFNNLLVKFKKE